MGDIKLGIIGSARSGKDTMAELFKERFGLNYLSTSEAAAKIFIFDALKDKYGYINHVECFEDRHNHRAEWYDLFCEYNKYDKAKLCRSIMSISDCYVGMRNRQEIKQCIEEGLFDLVIWVDAAKRIEMESADSFNVDSSCADIIVENNGDYKSFEEKVLRLGKIIFK
jgi:hypothetical protein